MVGFSAPPRILVAEDNVLVADMIAIHLREMGWEPVGPVPSAEAALRLAAAQRLDAAILDVRLCDADSFAVASALHSSGVPFLFLTGVHRDSVPSGFNAVPCIAKPFEWSAVQQTLLALLNRSSERPAAPLVDGATRPCGFMPNKRNGVRAS